MFKDNQCHKVLTLLVSSFLFGLIAQYSIAADKDGLDKVELGGRILYDIDFFNGFYNNGKSGSESRLRRARLYVKSRFNKQWLAKLEISIDDEEESTNIKDGYIRYRGWNVADLVLGKSKEPFGLESATSSKYVSTIERSAATSAFAPGRNYGIALHSANNQHHHWNLGLYEASENENGLDTYALTGRYTFSPINSEGELLHVGLSGSMRNWGGAEYEIQQTVSVDFADELDYGPKVDADTIDQLGLESAWVNGSLSLQGEWFQQQITVEDSDKDDDASYTGYYLQASYFLTGESRPYKTGKFARVKPHRSSGAWELVSSYSVLDAVDNGDGIESDTTLLGLSYYANKRTRLMINLLHTELSGPDVENEDSGDAVSFRGQYDF